MSNHYFTWPTSISWTKGVIGAGILLFICLSPLLYGFQLTMLLPMISYAIIHSLIEETLWRGMLLTLFVAHVGKTGAVLFTGLLYMMFYLPYHFSGLFFFGVLLFGITLAFLTIRTDSILPAFLLHVVANIIVITNLAIFEPFFLR